MLPPWRRQAMLTGHFATLGIISLLPHHLGASMAGALQVCLFPLEKQSRSL
jgi:hypothetical protein